MAEASQPASSPIAGAQVNANSAPTKTSGANLLSPNAALEVPGGGQQQQRRKSTLSANGFFIDYSCTRRRSSARPAHAQEDSIRATLSQNQFLRNVVSPVQRAGAMSSGAERNRGASFCVAGGPSGQSLSARAQSRAGYCSSGPLHAAGSSPMLGVPAAPAAARLAGSRKTSIFDPAGHTLVAAHRRKSTMVTGGESAACAAAAVQLSPAIEQAATMLAVGRQAAALQKSKSKSELVQRVPVIGCSPTSIRASLAALEETRRYEKLLRKLKCHQKRKEKERKRRLGAQDAEDAYDSQDSICDINLLDDEQLMRLDDDDHGDHDNAADSGSSSSRDTCASDNGAAGPHHRMSLRRKSIRAIKEAAALLNPSHRPEGSTSARRRRRQRRRRRLSRRWPLSSADRNDSFVDGLSISSTLSLASSQTSLPSIDRFLDELSLYDEHGETGQERYSRRHDDDDDYPTDGSTSPECDGGQPLAGERNSCENTDELSAARSWRQSVEKASFEQHKDSSKGSLVSKAMRKIASKLASSSARAPDPVSCGGGAEPKRGRRKSSSAAHSRAQRRCRRDSQAAPLTRRRRSISMSAGLNYWHYYYYLRSNSLDAADDLPLLLTSTRGASANSASAGAGATDALVAGHAAGVSGAPMSETERRARLYVNYSLARLEILNSSGDPVARLAERCARAATAQESSLEHPESYQAAGDSSPPAWNRLVDFSRSTDVSLNLSISSTSLESTSTSRNSSSLSSPVSTLSSVAIGFGRDTTTTNGDSMLAVGRQSASQAGPPRGLARRPLSNSSSSTIATTSQSLASQWKPADGSSRQPNAQLPPPPSPTSTANAMSRSSYATNAEDDHYGVRDQYKLRQLQADIHHWQASGASSQALPQWVERAPAPLAQSQQQQVHHHRQLDGGLSSASPRTATINDVNPGVRVLASAGGRHSCDGRGEDNGDDHKQHRHHHQDQRQSGGASLRQANSNQHEDYAAGELPGGRAFWRDAHFRFSVKSIRSKVGASFRRGGEASGEADGQQRRGESNAPLDIHTAPPPSARSIAAERRRSPAFLSWDTLAADELELELAEGQRWRHQRGADWPVGVGAASCARTENFISGDHPSNRRSFRQPRVASAGLAPTGWRLRSLVSPSRSSLFQRKASSKKKRDYPPGSWGEGDSMRAASSAANLRAADNGEQRRARDEQRRAADELLGEFEAQMSQAANLAAHSKQQARDKQLGARSHCDPDRPARSQSKLELSSASASGRLAQPTTSGGKRAPASSKLAANSSSASTSSASSMSLASSPRSFLSQPQQPAGQRSRTGSGGSATSSTSSRRQLAAELEPAQSRPAPGQQQLGLSLQVPGWQQSAPSNHSLRGGTSANNGQANKPARGPAGWPSDGNDNDRYGPPVNEMAASYRQCAAALAANNNNNRASNRHAAHARNNSDNVRSEFGLTVGGEQYFADDNNTEAEDNSTPRARAHSTGAGNDQVRVGDRHASTWSRGESSCADHLLTAANSVQTLHSLAKQTTRDIRMAQQQQQQHSNSHVAPPTTRSAINESQSQIRAQADVRAPSPESNSRAGQAKAHESDDLLVQLENESIHSHALDLLRKSSFRCTVLGARQTGKRAIVICFVKLLNEFKLATDEYKKEKMLTKLVECSERLHELAAKHEEELDNELEAATGQRQRRTSRLNSWLPSGGAMKSLLNLSPVSKRRLHSMANLWSGGTHQPSSVVASTGGRAVELTLLAGGGAAADDGGHARRHTAFEPPSFRVANSDENPTTTSAASRQTPDRSLNVSSANLSLCNVNNNKSDTNINYRTTNAAASPRQERHHSTTHQLQVPAQTAAALRKHSDPTTFRSQASTRTTKFEQERHASSYSTTAGTSPGGSSFLARSERQGQASGAPQDSRVPHLRRSSGSGACARRRQSICLSRRNKRLLLSLKELNRRKFAIKFNTRRQVSESFLQSMAEIEQKRDGNTERTSGSRRSMLLQLASASALPDSFIVVYSINDRESFDYAEALVGQLRARQLDIPLPIVLVANKSDLERNREVKTEDGRTLARRFSCKFIEISCAIGFNLDNLLVGLRTQLVLRHHIVLNSILRPGFQFKHKDSVNKKITDKKGSRHVDSASAAERQDEKEPAGHNILVRFYKRYVMDNYEQNDYDCDNFSKL